ncbi:MAG: SnoaL-like polyketide cyclase [Herminiimonas sp.]|nr:SnoaL-like polyketide cyclase [Herminiimonas sp.]
MNTKNIKTVVYAASLAIGSLAVLGGCASEGSSAMASGAPASAAMQRASDGVAIWNSHNLDAISQRYQPGATFSSPITGGAVPVAQMLTSLQGLFAAAPDVKVQVASVAAPDERTMVQQWVVSGTWTAPFSSGVLAGITPTGKAFTVPGATFFKLQDGKIISETQYYDQLAYIAQLGVLQKR